MTVAVRSTVAVHVEAHADTDVVAFDAGRTGEAFVSVRIGGGGGSVTLLLRDLDTVDVLVDLVADARAQLAHVLGETGAPNRAQDSGQAVLPTAV